MGLTKSFLSLLALINPIRAISFFISLTESQTDEEKRRTIRVALTSVVVVISLSALLGEQIISSLGSSVGSLQVSGGIIMIMITLNMLNAQISRTRITPEEEDETSTKASIAIVSLAIPLLTGLGSISTVIIYVGKTRRWWGLLFLAGVDVATAAIVWTALRAVEPVARAIGRISIDVGTCLMGLILAALAVKFIVDGLKTLLLVLRA